MNLTYILQRHDGGQEHIESTLMIGELRARAAKDGEIIGIAVNPNGKGEEIRGTLKVRRQCNDVDPTPEK